MTTKYKALKRHSNRKFNVMRETPGDCGFEFQHGFADEQVAQDVAAAMTRAYRRGYNESNGASHLDGGRPLPFGGEQYGTFAWDVYASAMGDQRSFLALPRAEQQVWERIGEVIGRWTLIGDAASQSLELDRVLKVG